jgi:hypothetical protein
MNNVKQVYRPPCLVCLKVSYEMPADLMAPDLVNLFLSFLDAILADVRRPELDQRLYRGRRMGLADGYQRDLPSGTAALFGGSRDAGADPRKSFCQWCFRGVNVCHNGIDTQS